MTILVTGAGLIGCHAAKRFVDTGHQVVLLDLSPNREYIRAIAGSERVETVAADLRDLPALLAAVQRFDVKVIIHTAGLIGRRVSENPYTGTTNNLLGTLHVLEAARLLELHRVVYVSTFGVYDRSKIAAGPITEDAPTGGHNLYTVTKSCSEQLVGAYGALYHLDAVILRPAAVFGRGHYAGGSTVGMIMRDLAREILKGGPVTIDASVYFANEYVYAKDVALAIELSSQAQGLSHTTFNVGSGVITTPRELGQIVRELAPGIEVNVAEEKTGDQAHRAALDLSRSRAELGYAPRFSLKDALRDYLEELKYEK